MKALVVDGYNAACKIPYVRALMDKDLKAARDGVSRLAEDYSRRKGGFARVMVVFDGRNEYRHPFDHCDRKKRFSRTGEGDAEVISAVRSLSKKYNVEVVSDDNFVRNNARAYNARPVSVREFAGASGSGGGDRSARKTLPSGAAKTQPDKITTQAAKAINDELKRYWNI
ncbi:MAG: NYN domain-containing protein [Candidatus Omnitrophica bacterium]|nr:NYN domain-containing protein [Candidatus Omnitrophota bacterium]